MKTVIKPKKSYRDHIRRYHPVFSDKKECYVTEFPDDGHFNGLMKIAAPKNNYSCGLEIAKLALRVQGIQFPAETIRRKIGLTNNGTDELKLFGGLREMGVKCEAYVNAPLKLLREKLESGKSIYILSMQHPCTTLNQILKVKVGHYMAACAYDYRYIYFADPAYKDGKVRIAKKHLQYLWYDYVWATDQVMYGYMIEVPVTVKH